MVVLGHARLSGRFIKLLAPFRQGPLGVAIFFVISGFLITLLLLKEVDKRGKVDLRSFYIRRAFRIFPPFYVFLAAVGILSLLKFQPVSLGSYLSAAFYVWNYNIHAHSWLLGHLWSLSLEEQFYLLWPWCLLFFSKRTCLWIASALVILSPISRVATYLTMPTYRDHIGAMLHTRIDTIMMGCLLALILNLNVVPGLLRHVNRLSVVLVAVGYVLFVNPVLYLRFRNAWDFPFGLTLQGLCCAVIVLYAINHAHNAAGWVLNHPVARHVGVISYGLYLWQQLFTGGGGGAIDIFPLNVVLIFGCAELSYVLVEKPSYYVRDKVLNRISKRPALVLENSEPSSF